LQGANLPFKHLDALFTPRTPRGLFLALVSAIGKLLDYVTEAASRALE
jgi:hypothetical protein